MSNYAIQLKDYSFRYLNTEKWVVKNCNFDVKYGELVVLSGLSGEGKSTLLSSINGIIPNVQLGEQEGEVFIDNKPIKNMKMSQISHLVGSVLQNPDSQIIHAKVEDEISFGCENFNFPKEEIGLRIEEASKLMLLNKEWNTKTLSGGQKQRLITASVLAMGQKILILDEPLANLDLEGAHTLLKLLKDLTRKGYAILIVEHRLDVVIPYAHRVAWLNDGRAEFYENKQDVFKKTSHKIMDDTIKKAISNENLIEVKNLCFDINNRIILKDLSFTIKKGERIVILGENGCGKTTLMRLLAKMLKPTSGEIVEHIDTRVKKKADGYWYKKLGFIYQNPNYQIFMPQVIEEVAYQSLSEEVTKEFMNTFYLDDLAQRHPHSLSEGQKRRLTIASILVMNPELILLDEPTVGQDYDGLQNIIKRLNDIHEKTGNTMITITHDYRCAAAIADRIIWLNEGKVKQIGGKELAEEYFKQNLESSRSHLTKT